MKIWLIATLTAIILSISGINAFAADDKDAGNKSKEDDSLYTKIAMVCQKQITEEKVADANERKEQISVCIEKGIDEADK